jgi:RHS repeat-associated protein
MTRTGTSVAPFQFAGGWQYQSDADSGLMLLGHRYYDSETGRFISPDPIGDGDNWYAYCDNNPLSWVDPSGLVKNRGRMLDMLGAILGLAGMGFSGEDKIDDVAKDPKKAIERSVEDEEKRRRIKSGGSTPPPPPTPERPRPKIPRLRDLNLLDPKYLPSPDAKKVANLLLKKGGKMLIKKIPVAGWLITGYELWQVYRTPNSTWTDYAGALL